MGELIDSVHNDEKRLLKVKLNHSEIKNLRGHRKKVYVFSGDNCVHQTNLLERGNKKEAKYFRVPKQLKKRKCKIRDINYQKIPLINKTFFIFTLNLKD